MFHAPIGSFRSRFPLGPESPCRPAWFHSGYDRAPAIAGLGAELKPTTVRHKELS
jgi:hypothetical protein